MTNPLEHVLEALCLFRFVDRRHLSIGDYLKADAAITTLRAHIEAEKGKADELEALRARWDRVVKAAEHAHGPDAIRFKLSLRKNGTATNCFPRWLDQRWVSFVFAEDDAHIGYIAKALDAAIQAGTSERGEG